ncbi:MAG TPA: glycosyltransferase family 39 protein [Solirubrobacteraceae bacterium]
MRHAVVQEPRLRWRGLARGDKVARAGIIALVLSAAGVRVWFMIGYPTAFVGFPDAGLYLFAAGSDIFANTQHPAGYPFFLRLLHHLGDNLLFTIGVQHVLGIASGLLLYKAVRRTNAPPWLGLLPAAVVFFGGTGLFLEHSIMSDSLFTFLQAVGVYAAIRALYDHRLRWSLLVGAAIGLSFWDRTVALSSAVLIPIVLLCAAPGGIRRRLLSALTVTVTVVALIASYVGSQYYFTGYLGYEQQSAWNLYGRVATFVDCSTFKPPSGTRFLCPSEPVGHRQSQAYYQYGATAPAPAHFGFPAFATLHANALLQEFSIAAIEHQPVSYVEAIAGGLGRYVFPRGGEGYTAEGLRESLVGESRAKILAVTADLLFPHSRTYLPTSEVQALSTYYADTQIEGPLLIFLLALAIAGALFLPARMRWAAIVFTLTALLSIVFAVAGTNYDVRYAYPTFGPLAAGSALGAWGIASFLAGTIRRRSSSRARRDSQPSVSATALE